MSNVFETYAPRKIEFHRTLNVRDWNIKLYTITKNDEFGSGTSLNALIEKIARIASDCQSI